MQREDVRNIAIIAHVDHGKTTLVDQLLKQSGIFRSNEVVADRVMDSNDIERERGITILAKNTAVHYKGTKINIIDTPGHADFGGEVERILSMVDGVLLLVDAIEGCMPQTRYVLKKALGLGKKALVVINKVDKGEFDEQQLQEQILELFMELGATDDQFDFKIIYASAKQGWATNKLGEPGVDMKPLLDAILTEIPAPEGDIEGGLQLLICNIDYDEYVGRIGIGKVNRGKIYDGQQVMVCHKDNKFNTAKVARLYQFDGLKRVECTEGSMGDIVAVNGIADMNIGETLCSIDCVEPLPFVNIDEPTISMVFSVNNSPFAGKEGKYVTSRHLRARLFKEVETNVSMRVEETDSPDSFKVYGRGELHLSILIENMRREGYEFQVSRPKVIFKEVNGEKYEPMEYLVVEVPEAYVGTVMNKLGARKGELVNMYPDNQGSTRLEFRIPARCLIGYRSEMLTDTKGFGVMSSVFDGYEPYKGDVQERSRGSLVCFEDGVTTAYGLFNAQERCRLFVGVGLPVYAGMIVGENSREDDITVNVCKTKHLTNNRASGSDEALKLTPPTVLSLEQCLEFINDDELVEVTPTSIRLRKAILDHSERMRIWARNNKKS
ncbi:gTP-binding protein TypA/BipA [Corallococcus sp. CAG:1435]|uniref:Large ribosomal subunit assembly factor BipA n=1 Tax=Candidatus Fimimonas gallinarum TaxID=2840821 RepID=A0A9D1E4G2_9BACT|nr:gTP-binding protein TypA/BipA [Corallococcus sp. CAG:1435]HIR66114.1 translational GTPase TypA [Candidatus Fimimonas gallinarum]